MKILTNKQKNNNLQIEYFVTNCRLGKLLIAFTTKGIVAVYINDHTQSLIDTLYKEFLPASILQLTSNYPRWYKKIINYIEGTSSWPRLPYDIKATIFQRLVWDKLRDIKPSQTLTYSQLAQAINKPLAVRAVASACARNQACIIIPCHRIVPKAGGVGKFRWGSDIKKYLLKIEKKSDSKDNIQTNF